MIFSEASHRYRHYSCSPLYFSSPGSLHIEYLIYSARHWHAAFADFHSAMIIIHIILGCHPTASTSWRIKAGNILYFKKLIWRTSFSCAPARVRRDRNTHATAVTKSSADMMGVKYEIVLMMVGSLRFMMIP